MRVTLQTTVQKISAPGIISLSFSDGTVNAFVRASRKLNHLKAHASTLPLLRIFKGSETNKEAGTLIIGISTDGMAWYMQKACHINSENTFTGYKYLNPLSA